MERPVLPSTKAPWFRYPEDLDPVLRDIRDNLDVLDSDVDDIQSGALPIALPGIAGALGEWTGWVNLGIAAGVDPTGVADSYAGLQAAYNTIPEGGFGYLPPGSYKLSQTLITNQYRSLVGAGTKSRLVADNIAGPVVCTFSGTLDEMRPYQRFRDFAISGTADCALSFAHCYGTVAERIKLISFTGVDGFRFEGIWQCSFRDLDTSNTTIGRACFKVNKTCLDSIWSLCYTGGTSHPDYALYVDQFASDDGNMSVVSSHELHFDTFTAQGADVVGIAIVNGSQITLTNPYTESNHIPVQFGNVAQSNWHIQVFGGRLLGGRGAETPFDLVVNAISNLSICGSRFYDQPIILGNIPNSGLFSGVGCHSSTTIPALMERTVDASGDTPITLVGDQRASGSAITLNVAGTHDLQAMTVDGTGAWTATKTSIPLSLWRAVKSITSSGLTATLETYIAHGYTTGNTVQIECASPRVFNGTYTITVTDATHFTYTIASTPRESPAIGQPMVKKL